MYFFYLTDLLPSKGGAGLTTKFLKEVVEILVEYVQGTFDRSTKILEFHHPNELRERLHLEIPDKPENLDQILQDCQNTLKYCVHTGKKKHLFIDISFVYEFGMSVRPDSRYFLRTLSSIAFTVRVKTNHLYYMFLFVYELGMSLHGKVAQGFINVHRQNARTS